MSRSEKCTDNIWEPAQGAEAGTGVCGVDGLCVNSEQHVKFTDVIVRFVHSDCTMLYFTVTKDIEPWECQGV